MALLPIVLVAVDHAARLILGLLVLADAALGAGKPAPTPPVPRDLPAEVETGCVEPLPVVPFVSP